MDWLRGKKTYIVAALMVMVSLLNVLTGETTLGEFFNSGNINTLLEGIGFGALRAGVAKAGDARGNPS